MTGIDLTLILTDIYASEQSKAFKITRVGRLNRKAPGFLRSRIGVSHTRALFLVMTDTNTKSSVPGKAMRRAKEGTLQLPPALTIGLNHFFNFNEDPETVKKHLFDLLHYTFESKTADSLNHIERGNLFFTVRELMHLVDVLFKEKRIFLNQIKPRKS